MKKNKWIDSGLLEGIEEKHHEQLSRFFNIAVEIIEKKKTDDTLPTLIFPVIRKIFGLVVSDDDRYYKFKNDKDIEKKVIYYMDIDDIINKLIIHIKKIIPYISSHFGYIDVQAEMTLLFCKNYTGWILDEYYDVK